MTLNLDIELLLDKKFCVFAGFVVCFFSHSLINGRSLEHSNEAWLNVIQLLVWVCNDFFHFEHIFLIISSFI